MPMVSVILPTCDRPHLWPRALSSVLRQTWADLEVLLIDNNRRLPPLSGDPNFGRMRQDPRVRLVRDPEAVNASQARNAGLKEATGEWITYLDDDDFYDTEKIGAQLRLARAEAAPLVLCGYTVNLPKRRRTRQVHTGEFKGDELLTGANWGTPFLFHRRDPGLVFDETLAAGHDEVFAHMFLARHDMRRVPNCARSLVEVYPQVGAARVHRDGDQIWRAYRENWRQSGRRFSRPARRSYLAMGRLVRAQSGYGGVGHFAHCAWAALVTRGPGAWRLVANATAHRFGLLRNWVVS